MSTLRRAHLLWNPLAVPSLAVAASCQPQPPLRPSPVPTHAAASASHAPAATTSPSHALAATTAVAINGTVTVEAAATSMPIEMKNADKYCRSRQENYGDDLDPSLPKLHSVLSLSIEHFGPFPTRRGTAEAWATPAGSLTPVCTAVGTSAPKPAGFYRGGGFIQNFCSYELGGKTFKNERELVDLLGPIDAPRKALARIALTTKLAWEPDVTPSTRRVFMNATAVKIRRAFEFEKTDDGYFVKVPISNGCSMISQSTFFVSREGAVCKAKARAQLIDIGTPPICGD
jgi:hypothetical protein